MFEIITITWLGAIIIWCENELLKRLASRSEKKRNKISVITNYEND